LGNVLRVMFRVASGVESLWLKYLLVQLGQHTGFSSCNLEPNWLAMEGALSTK